MICKLERARVSVVFDRRGVAHDDVAATVEIMIYEPRVRRRRYVSTGVRVRACEWDDRYWVVGRGDARSLNDRIREQVAKCEGAIDVDGCDAAVACIKSSRAGDSFLRWMEDEIEASQLEDSTKRQHMVMLRNLEQWGRMRRFDCVTSRNIEAWLDGIRATGADQVTVHGYYKRLRKWVNVAIRKRMLPADCLVEMSVPRGKSKERSFLTDDEIETVRTLQLPNAHLCNARDRFLVQMGCGLSYSDFVDVDFTRHQLLGGHETLQGRRKKTGEQFFLVMLPFAVEILDRWGWVVPTISNAKYNDYLSTIMMIAGIDKKVTSHVARHSYACYCLRHGVRIEAVQRTLGHSDIKTTQIYARLVDMDVVDAFGHLK